MLNKYQDIILLLLLLLNIIIIIIIIINMNIIIIIYQLLLLSILYHRSPKLKISLLIRNTIISNKTNIREYVWEIVFRTICH